MYIYIYKELLNIWPYDMNVEIVIAFLRLKEVSSFKILCAC